MLIENSVSNSQILLHNENGKSFGSMWPALMLIIRSLYVCTLCVAGVQIKNNFGGAECTYKKC